MAHCDARPESLKVGNGNPGHMVFVDKNNAGHDIGFDIAVGEDLQKAVD